MPLVTLDQAKSALNITTTADDTELQGYVDAITGVVENWVHEVIDQRPVTDEKTFFRAHSFVLPHTPILSLTSIVATDGSYVWDVSQFHVNGQTGRVTLLSGPPVGGQVEITYLCGYQTPPGRYVQGALVILQHVWETQRGVEGAGLGVVGDEELHDRLYSFSIPRKALEWLGPQPPVVA